MTKLKEAVAACPPKALFAAGAFLPWVWAVAFVPWWVAATSAACAVGLLGGYALWAWRREARDAPADSVPQAEPLSDNLGNFLHRWSGMAHETHDNLHDVRNQIHGVMEQTERAVLNISGCFRNITSKTNEQMEQALSLLRSTSLEPESHGAVSAISLPEYVRSSSELLSQLADQLLQCTEMYSRLLTHENAMQVGDRKMDELSEEVQSLLNEIVALTSKVRDQRLAEQINSLGCRALKAANIARNHMHALRLSRSDTHKAICNISSETKDAAEAVKKELSLLTANMLEKNHEVAGIVERINALGEEVRKDIYKVIVELQFQDITHQQLERVRTPLVNQLSQGLRAIAQETHLLYQRLRRSIGERADEHLPDVKQAARPSPPQRSAAPGKDVPPQDLGNKVELF